MEIDSGYDDDANLMFPRTNPKFPEGLSFYARRIASTGARPGIILNFAGYSGFDMLAQHIRLGVEMGFADIKINRTGLSIPDEALKERTLFEYKREGFAKLREAAGQETYLLYNDSRPERVTVGMVDANRTGSWASRESVRMTMTDVLRSYHLNGRWFAVDPDSYYMGTDIDNVSAIKGGWPLVRTWMSMVGLSCGAAITADPWHWESFRPLLAQRRSDDPACARADRGARSLYSTGVAAPPWTRPSCMGRDDCGTSLESWHNGADGYA
jgi:hypothetical protein